jgi:hypothetical protein
MCQSRSNRMQPQAATDYHLHNVPYFPSLQPRYARPPPPPYQAYPANTTNANNDSIVGLDIYRLGPEIGKIISELRESQKLVEPLRSQIQKLTSVLERASQQAVLKDPPTYTGGFNETRSSGLPGTEFTHIPTQKDFREQLQSNDISAASLLLSLSHPGSTFPSQRMVERNTR